MGKMGSDEKTGWLILIVVLFVVCGGGGLLWYKSANGGGSANIKPAENQVRLNTGGGAVAQEKELNGDK